jgi:hypothetical protein
MASSRIAKKTSARLRPATPRPTLRGVTEAFRVNGRTLSKTAARPGCLRKAGDGEGAEQ